MFRHLVCNVPKDMLGYRALLVCIIWITYYRIIIWVRQAKLLYRILPTNQQSSIEQAQSTFLQSSMESYPIRSDLLFLGSTGQGGQRAN